MLSVKKLIKIAIRDGRSSLPHRERGFHFQEIVVMQKVVVHFHPVEP